MRDINANEQPRVLVLASVASMIDLFNTENIAILKRLGCKVDVAANFSEGSITSQQRVNEYKEELKEQQIEVLEIPVPRSIFQFSNIIKSYRIVKELAQTRHYRIVHCHSPIGGVIARLAFKAVRKAGTKVIYTGHGLHFFKGAPLKNWIMFYPVERYCAKLTDVLIAINQEDYKREKTWNCSQVEYVPGIGVDTKAYLQTSVDRKKMRAELGFDENDFVFMSTGQVSVRKNHEVIIRALSKIDDDRIKYLIVGFGELEEKLKSLTKTLGIEGRVVFAGYRRDVKQLLHAVDAFAFPSLQEGLPVALMEAMAAGLPIVCSNIRGNVDLITNGEGGFIYDCQDVEGFAKGITRIAKDDVASRMKKINLDRIRDFDKDIVNAKMERIYKEQLKEIG